MQLQTVLVSVLVVCALATPVAVGSANAAQTCTFPVTKTDASGTEVTVEGEPERVVTLNPSAAQTMWEIGAREKVVGLSEYAMYLDGADERTVISGEEQVVVIEEVVDLEPDLVLAPNTIENGTVEQLRRAGVTVYHFPAEESVEDVYEHTRLIGDLTGECEGAEATVTWMQDRMAVVEETVASQERPEVLYLFYGYTAGEGTFIHELIEAAGGTNVAAAAGITGYQQISAEVVVNESPDWILLNSDDPALPESEGYNETTAAQEGQVVVVPIEHLNQPAPRIVYAITTMAEHFYPDAYASANATATATDTPTATPTTSSTPTPTQTDGQPGFGLLGVLLAIVAAIAARAAR